MSKPMEIERPKIVEKWNDVNQKHEPRGEYIIRSPARHRYFTQCVPLQKAALKGDWEAAKELLIEDPTLVKSHITEGRETALHIAAVQGHTNFVEKLLNNMTNPDLEILNDKDCSALCFAAAAGNVEIAKRMLKWNRNLPTIRGEKGFTPLYMAALSGHGEMAEYLFPLSDFQSWATQNQIQLLTTSIRSGLYDLAVSIVKQYQMLAAAVDSYSETPLQVLASKPSAFSGTSRQGFWGNIARTISSYMNLTTCKTTAPCDAYALLNCLWDIVAYQEDAETGQVSGNFPNLLFTAAESGNDGFLVEIIRRNPDLIYHANNSKHSIFHIAVSHRHVKVFNLIYELGGVKDLIASYIDKDGNNILHLAATLAPKNKLNRIPWAALQMQQEVLWYKEVQKIVSSTCRNMKNSAGQTPYDLFLTEHENLMKQGEKQMKEMAKSCMLMTMLIATIVFATALSVPGSYNSIRAPIPQNEKLFIVFPISEAIATLASLTSMLTFLSVLTSRCSDNDFLRSLPFLLVVGMAALFVSIVTMVVAICTSLLFYDRAVLLINVVVVFFVCVPIIFVISQYPLLIAILHCTYGSKGSFQSNNRLFL